MTLCWKLWPERECRHDYACNFSCGHDAGKAMTTNWSMKSRKYKTASLKEILWDTEIDALQLAISSTVKVFSTMQPLKMVAIDLTISTFKIIYWKIVCIGIAFIVTNIEETLYIHSYWVTSVATYKIKYKAKKVIIIILQLHTFDSHWISTLSSWLDVWTCNFSWVRGIS